MRQAQFDIIIVQRFSGHFSWNGKRVVHHSLDFPFFTQTFHSNELYHVSLQPKILVNVPDSSNQPKHRAAVLGNIKYFNADVHNGAIMYFTP